MFSIPDKFTSDQNTSNDSWKSKIDVMICPSLAFVQVSLNTTWLITISFGSDISIWSSKAQPLESETLMK